jgi:hypothetical protein
MQQKQLQKGGGSTFQTDLMLAFARYNNNT